ncbi:uncharacterized protein K489DRAFT_4119 [Dissoconium aciculare CBS 342.82]|uniref:Uncharacterized protein n=1 Tax=Dissoconium aciculare CBS 342.82 TaxID=1314786 RepID=A0A6J3MGL5_9PEZI|nr:uncharacterized protein K489DRAFT_4119 [Dissoconium aciculare CBS 342.82]KAF1827013.1 hypothetical protein K489DRAFT_4119 [Dissoconium aciculare CBS 342.82]
MVLSAASKAVWGLVRAMLSRARSTRWVGSSMKCLAGRGMVSGQNSEKKKPSLIIMCRRGPGRIIQTHTPSPFLFPSFPCFLSKRKYNEINLQRPLSEPPASLRRSQKLWIDSEGGAVLLERPGAISSLVSPTIAFLKDLPHVVEADLVNCDADTPMIGDARQHLWGRTSLSARCQVKLATAVGPRLNSTRLPIWVRRSYRALVRASHLPAANF